MFLNNFYKALNVMFVQETVNGINASGTKQQLTTAYCVSSAFKIKNYIGAINSSYSPGIVFGNGSTLVTPDDYCLSGDVIDTINGSADVQTTINDDYCEFVVTYTMTNVGNSPITIGEIGLCLPIASSPTLVERTVLETPITIEAGGVGQVTYTIRMNYPTA